MVDGRDPEGAGIRTGEVSKFDQIPGAHVGSSDDGQAPKRRCASSASGKDARHRVGGVAGANRGYDAHVGA